VPAKTEEGPSLAMEQKTGIRDFEGKDPVRKIVITGSLLQFVQFEG
jgi:hypothetical protein